MPWGPVRLATPVGDFQPQNVTKITHEGWCWLGVWPGVGGDFPDRGRGVRARAW